MFESDDAPRASLLTCGHVWLEDGPEPVTPHRVVRHGSDWAVESRGSWCATCVARGKAAQGMTWAEAWAEVERRRAGGSLG